MLEYYRGLSPIVFTPIRPMADLDPKNTSNETAAAQEAAAAPNDAPESLPVTREQAEKILAELKTIKQNLLWLLLLGGFFAARAFFFHY
jgi:hypothetical protein